jgi:hypothetical protein
MKHTAEVKLRPCPWGSEHRLQLTADKERVSCTQDGCPVGWYAIPIVAWNTRPHHDRLVEALRKALVFCEAEQECREASCLPEPTKDEEPYLEEASEIVDLLRAALAAEDAYEEINAKD